MTTYNRVVACQCCCLAYFYCLFFLQCFADNSCSWCTWIVGLNLSKFDYGLSLLLGMWYVDFVSLPVYLVFYMHRPKTQMDHFCIIFPVSNLLHLRQKQAPKNCVKWVVQYWCMWHKINLARLFSNQILFHSSI